MEDISGGLDDGGVEVEPFLDLDLDLEIEMTTGLRRFLYHELVAVMWNFALEEKLGQTSFGSIYRRHLGENSSLVVAIMRFTKDAP
jgi:hypothetical protein